MSAKASSVILRLPLPVWRRQAALLKSPATVPQKCVSSRRLIQHTTPPAPVHLTHHPQRCHLALSHPWTPPPCPLPPSPHTLRHPSPRLPTTPFPSVHEKALEEGVAVRKLARPQLPPAFSAGKGGGSWGGGGGEGLHLDKCQLEVFVLFLLPCWWWGVVGCVGEGVKIINPKDKKFIRWAFSRSFPIVSNHISFLPDTPSLPSGFPRTPPPPSTSPLVTTPSEKSLSHMYPMGSVPWRVQAPHVELSQLCVPCFPISHSVFIFMCFMFLRHTNLQTHKTYKPTDLQTNRPTDQQTHKDTHIQKYRHTDRQKTTKKTHQLTTTDNH